jgi:molybdopterin-guanine dinucleotide biosynthesis protein MobB
MPGRLRKVMNLDRPLIIGIGGAHSSIGKTTLAASVIRYLSSGKPCSLFNKTPRVGAIKYTKENIFASVTDDEAIIGEKGKDTARLAEAGSEKTVWIRSSAENLDETLPLAMERMPGLDVIVIEGNSAIEFAKPDIIIFIQGGADDDTKPSAERLRRIADIIIEKAGRPGRCAAACIMKELPARIGDDEMEVIIKLMEDTSKKKKIIELLGQKAVEGRITCAVARMIAEETGAPYSSVGAAANELKIKIRNCELGCF